MKKNLHLCLVLLALMLTGKTSSQPTCYSRELFESIMAYPYCNSQIDRAKLPQVTIKVNIHFVGSFFYPGNPDDNSVYNGNKMANDIIMKLNEYAVDLLPSVTQSDHFLGDSRVRFQLFSKEDHPLDIHGGIWYWPPTTGSSFVYGNNVMNIVIDTETTQNHDGIVGCFVNGSSCLTVYNIHNKIISEEGPITGYNEHATAARIILHEIGHITGLCHSFSTENPCADINALNECNGTLFGSPNDCGSDSNQACQNDQSGSSNVMAYNSLARSMSPCQWTTYYHYLYVVRPSWVWVFDENCDFSLPLPGAPEVIPAGVHAVWDGLRLVFQDVIIETGASLTIRCQVLMAPGRSISVRRGSKLLVEGGEIRNMLPGQPWRTIFVEGNASQPQPDPFLPVSSLPGPNEAGVVQLESARIVGAGTAISTSKKDLHYQSEYWGGVVSARNTAFIDNRRGVEFMAYRSPQVDADGVPIPNKSRFTDCSFEADSELYLNSAGVSIWNCNGISFRDCRFKGFSLAAIYGIDFGMSVTDGCIFEDNIRGVEIFATRPLAGHRTFVENSEFFYTASSGLATNNLAAHIQATATNELDGLFVFNGNQFGSGRRGVRAIGPGAIRIVENTFDDQRVMAITLEGCGPNQNRIKCNDFYRNLRYAVNLLGPNEELKVLYNNFNYKANDPFFHIANDRMGVIPGRIDPFQGFSNDPARNCFFVPPSGGPLSIRAYTSNTLPFTYYSIAASNLPPNCTWIPTGNLTDGGSNNYISEIIPVGTQIRPIDCSVNIPPVLATTTEQELADAGVWLETKRQELLTAPYAAGAQEAYHRAYDQYQALWVGMLRSRQAQADYPGMEALLLPASTEQAKRWLLGVYLESQQWGKAQLAWNSLPDTTPEQTAFRAVMAINLELLQAGFGVDLDSLQESTLFYVAESPTPSRAYAQSLLALYRGVRFPDDYEEELAITPPGARWGVSQPVVRIHPNPTNDWLYLHFTPEENDQPVMVWLSDLQGRPVQQWQQMATPEGVAIDLTTIPSGLYFLRLRIGHGQAETHKIVKP